MGTALALIGAGTLAGLIAGRWVWVRRPSSVETPAEREAVLSRPTLNSVRVLRGDDIAALAERDALELVAELRPFLEDVARQHGASEVTLWRHATDSNELSIVASTGEADPPMAAAWGTPKERSLIAWSAAEQLVGFDRRDGEPRLAICPVRFALGEAPGAIVLSATERFTTEREALRDWMPRHAAQVARLASLFSTRNEVARQSRFTRALLRIARDLQRVHEASALERALCDYATEVTGAEFAALIRWDAAARSGRVAAASEHTPSSMLGSAVTASSVAGAVCVEGVAAFWEDARFLAERGGLLRDDDADVAAGSMAVLPMMRGPDAIGALVIGAQRAGVLRALEIRNGSVLSALAVNALETSWELADASRRSRTDALTGLWNRLHFDEQLERVLAETDRFGGTCALVLCDLDYFKRVNDSYGHDAGDAVLRQVAAMLHAGVRTVDVCARIGGEELALILPRTAAEGAVELAERLRRRVAGTAVTHDGLTIHVTLSIGVAVYSGGREGRTSLFKLADQRLYEAKQQGRDRVVS